MSLPKFMVLKSDASGKYLCYGKGEGSTVPSLLSFSHEMKHPTLNGEFQESLKQKKDESVTTPEEMSTELHLLKFEVEEAKSAPGLIHIKTGYNNKYLIRVSEKSHTIVAEAHEAEEDQSKWYCTLFKPIFLGDVNTKNDDDEDRLFGNKHGIGMIPQKIQLIHVASRDHVHVCNNGSMELTYTPTTLIVSDVEPTATLPNLFAFRYHDGMYLGSPDGLNLWFRYSDIGTEGVAMNVESNKYIGSKKYNGRYVRADSSLNVGLDTSKNMQFSPVKVNDFVALYAPDIGKFVNYHEEDHGVTAHSPNIINETKFEVLEPVLSRTIVSITYDLTNARVYRTVDVTKISDSRSNYTDHQQTGLLTRDFTMTRTMTWNQGITVSVGIAMEMSYGIPDIGLGGKVDINYNDSETCTWGEEKTKTETISHTYYFDIPPMTNQTKVVTASKSYCDVPFSCVVKDLLADGTTRTYTKTDGLFTGANDYNIVEETHDKPL